MSDRRRLFSRSSVPCGLIGMLALIAVVETSVSRNEESFSSDRSADWKDRGRAIRRQAERGEIFCFGDSLVKFGVIPKILEDRLGKRTFNCSLVGGQPTTSYFLLKRALDSGAKPAAILVDFHAFLLAESFRFNTPAWPGFATTLECLDLAWATGDLDFFASTMLSRPLLTLRSRHEIRVAILQALRDDPLRATVGTRDWIRHLRRNWALNKGAMVAAKNPAFHGQTENFPQPLFPEGWKADPVNKLYARRFMKLAAARGIPVFWLIPPHCPGVQAGRERVGADAAYDRFVRSIQARFPEVVVIDGRRAGYEDSLFIDPIHLDRDGATNLSVAVAEAMRPYLAGRPGPSRVDLPGIRGLDPIGLALEDVNQSRAAVTARDASRAMR